MQATREMMKAEKKLHRTIEHFVSEMEVTKHTSADSFLTPFGNCCKYWLEELTDKHNLSPINEVERGLLKRVHEMRKRKRTVEKKRRDKSRFVWQSPQKTASLPKIWNF